MIKVYQNANQFFAEHVMRLDTRYICIYSRILLVSNRFVGYYFTFFFLFK